MPSGTPRPEDETQFYDPASGPATGASALSLTTGQLVGKCKIVGPLGQGGMGVVYRAHHQTLDLPVAVKLLHYVGPPDGLAAFQERFQREAQVAARLTHQNLVGCKDFGWEQGVGSYLVMELVEGQSLEELLDERGKLQETEALELATGVADGLAVAHAAGVVHRDVKPANLLIAQDGTIKVADLGLARDLDGHGTTRTGQVLGTPAYMAPEQANDTSSVGPATDVYALGVTLFQALTGSLPFDGGTTMEILYKHVNSPSPDPREHGAALTAPTIELLQRMLAKDPADRPADGAETAAQIRRIVGQLRRDGDGAAARSPGAGKAEGIDALSPQRGARWGLRALGIAAAVVLVVLLVQFRDRFRHPAGTGDSSAGPESPAAHATVEEELTRKQLRQVLADIRTTSLEGYRTLHANLVAEEWKRRSTPAEIQRQLEGFLKKRPRRMRGERPPAEPVFTMNTRPQGGYRVEVVYRSPRGDLKLEMELVKEQGTWKLAGFEPPRR